jgi:hypothetical protein
MSTFLGFGSSSDFYFFETAPDRPVTPDPTNLPVFGSSTETFHLVSVAGSSLLVRSASPPKDRVD